MFKPEAQPLQVWVRTGTAPFRVWHVRDARNKIIAGQSRACRREQERRMGSMLVVNYGMVSDICTSHRATAKPMCICCCCCCVLHVRVC